MQPLCISHTPQRTIATVTRHQCNLNATVTRHSAPSQQSHDTAHHRNSHTTQRTIATVTRHQCNLNATVTRHSAPSQHIAHHRNTSRTIATPSPMSSFQHSPHTSFIFFSFFKHIKREKLNINNQHTIHLFIEK